MTPEYIKDKDCTKDTPVTLGKSAPLPIPPADFKPPVLFLFASAILLPVSE